MKKGKRVKRERQNQEDREMGIKPRMAKDTGGEKRKG